MWAETYGAELVEKTAAAALATPFGAVFRSILKVGTCGVMGAIFLVGSSLR
jgi:hypothetical protein